ncbi:MAG: TolC family protein, partial [Elusimicrobia bacterium]|nr:TolC family protein [Elusimicrobiota bacterium]
MRTLALLLLALSSRPAAAQSTRTLTWEDCVGVAESRNPQLLSSRGFVAASRATYYGSFNGFLPQVSLTNSVNDSRGADGSSRWQAGASAAMSLLDLSKSAAIRSARAGLVQSEAELRQQ